MKKRLRCSIACLLSVVTVCGGIFAVRPQEQAKVWAASANETDPNTPLAASMAVTFRSSTNTVGPDRNAVSIPGVPSVKATGLFNSDYIQIDGMPDYGIPDIGGRVYVSNAPVSGGGGWTYEMNHLMWTDGKARPVIYVDSNGNYRKEDGTLTDGLSYVPSPLVNYTTKDGLVSYCIQGTLASPGGITATMFSDAADLNSSVSKAGRDRAGRILENGYPLNEAYWLSKGIPAEAQRYATQAAIWCALRSEPGNDDTWYREFLGDRSKYRTNVAVNGQVIDVMGMIRTLVDCAENGKNLYAEPAASVSAGGVSIEDSSYVVSFTVASNTNAGFGFCVPGVTGAQVKCGETQMTPDAGGWYHVSSGLRTTVTVTVPADCGTDEVRLRVIPADTRSQASVWWAQGSGHTGTEGNHAGSTMQDMVVIHTQSYWFNDHPAQASQKLPKVSVTVQKEDAETGNRPQGDALLSGAVYGLYDGEGTLLARFPETDASGKTSISGLSPGTDYRIRELQAPVGYKLSEEEYTVRVSGTDGMKDNVIPVVVRAKDEVIRQKLRLIKTGNRETEPVRISGAGFTFYLLRQVLAENGISELPQNEEGKTDLSGLRLPEPIPAGENGEIEIFTGEDGTLTTQALPYGEYLAVETTEPEEYLAAEPFVIFLGSAEESAAEEIKTVSVEDEPFRVVLKLIKTDENGNTIEQKNTEFCLYDRDRNLLSVQETDGNGNVTVQDSFRTDADGTVTIPLPLVCGDYFIRETKAPVGYASDEGYIPVSVRKRKVTAGEEGEEYEAVLHTVREPESDTDLTTAEVKIRNRPLTVAICKTDAVDGEGAHELSGAKLTVSADDTIYDAEGNIWKEAGEEVESWVSDADSPHIMKALPAGKYVLTEETAPFGYSVAESVKFTVTDTAETQKVIMADRPSLGCLSVRKYDSVAGTPIEGTEFTLYYAEDVIDTDGNVIHSAGETARNVKGEEVILRTGADGTAQADQIPIGTYNGDGSFGLSIHYFLKETRQSRGYIPDETEFPVVFEWEEAYRDEVPVEIEIGNRAQTGRIGVMKQGEYRCGSVSEQTEFGELVSLSYETRPLEGTEFTVYEDAACSKEAFRLTTDAEGKAFSGDLPLGTYYIKETAAPTGFALDGQVHELTLQGDESGEEHIADVIRSEVNHPCKAAVRIQKNGTAFVFENGKYVRQEVPLKGVVFGIFTAEPVKDTEGKKILIPKDSLIACLETAENGIAQAKESLPQGRYYCMELKTREGFAAGKERYDFSVEASNEEQIKIEVNENKSVINTAASGELIIRKTDETGNSLVGAEFILKNVQTGSVIRLESDSSGLAKAEDLEIGYLNEKGEWKYFDYVLTERKAPSGYITDRTEHELRFIQKENGENKVTVTTEISNKKKSSTVPVLGIISGKYIGIGIMAFALLLLFFLLIGKKRIR